jgi:hypothetical protein
MQNKLSSIVSSITVTTMTPSFAKIASRLFDPMSAPPIKPEVATAQQIAAEKDYVRKGMSPVQYRNSLTSRKKNVISANRNTPKVT